MVKKIYPHYSLIITKLIVFLIIFILINGQVFAQNNNNTLIEEISDPGQIPNFHDFDTPTIVPGSTGKLKFTITNRYNSSNFDEYNMNSNLTLKKSIISNATLIVNIYLYSTLEENKDTRKLSHSPKIVGGNSALETTINQWTAEFYWPKILANESVPVELKIKSFSESPEGTYFVRMHLSFSFKDKNGTSFDFDMKSRGYFTDQEWEKAQANSTETDEYPIVGRLNLNILDVDGIIPESSFRVKQPIPIWPLYVLIGFAVLFVILAVIFYYMDEKGKFPETKKKLDEVSERVKNFRYRR